MFFGIFLFVIGPLSGKMGHQFKGIFFLSTTPDFDPETGELIEAPKPNLAEQSVSELSQALKRTLEDRFGHVRVRGEISGFKGAHSSGHVYFALKDEGAKLDAIIWRG
ncbi:MAG TPA: exodeoxyribonuclease VII large subunit, partial [Aestuariivirga sp.]